ncbi:MAG: maleylacetoacetate isomerase [Pseudomonadota bacterium]
MSNTQATLYGYYRSSTSYRLRILLNLKGIDYKSVPVALDRGEQREAAFLDINPMGGLPVLEIDGLRLVQAPAMIDYIEEHYAAHKLLPDAAAPRQRVREIAAIVACDIHPLNNLRVLKHLRANYGADDAAIADWYRHWINAAFPALEHMVGANEDAPFCVDGQLSLAEIYLIPQIYNAERFDIDMTAYPRLAGINAHCTAMPAFADAHPDRHRVD